MTNTDRTHVAPLGAIDRSESGLLVPVFTHRQKWVNDGGLVLWFASLVWFWNWWLTREHVIGVAWYAALSVTLLWVTLLPLYFLLIFRGACKPRSGLTPPEGVRIAMVVTQAPSEPFAVLVKTLAAMLNQRLPDGVSYDVWLASEKPDAETKHWCAEHGVHLSTRQDDAAYHRATWPRRTRCKEGNLAYFYDHFGYRNYDVVSQLDADHVPEEDYLWHMLVPFNDPQVGYVSAPSICDANAATSWSARSRLYAEGSLHGALQAGYNNGWAPLCIGSHYAVRTKALQAIGGLGPELAEDHSTTLLMNAGGWKGVHALDATAHGDGPATFADLATQEFQWSRSLVTILLRHSSEYVPHLNGRLKFQFLFSQLWYPLFSVFMGFMFLLPGIALLRNEPFVGVTYPEFLLHFVPMSVILVALAIFWKRGGWLRPMSAKIISWEASLFLLARWPWALMGSLAAVWDRFSHGFVDFKVTPKGAHGKQLVAWKIIAPYLLLSAVSAAPIVGIDNESEARGFILFAAVNAGAYAFIAALIILQHYRETEGNFYWAILRQPIHAAVVGMMLLLPMQLLTDKGASAIEALSYGADPLRLTRTSYIVAGAGMGRSGTRHVSLSFRWMSE
ncbi:glycosyltransferase [Cohaesibacter haloalkalitolerans]|uniref:glycosyltransferase n=1 Tax=Cohaesibacter haloalkalitolerans TaxID=1162980 RepID=UPI000E64734B|nr:glycosyltransferase [Cohaesibacter haloalkalitolerans]